MNHESVEASQGAVEEAVVTVDALFPRGWLYCWMPALARSYIGTPKGGKDWTRIRSSIDRRRHDGRAPRELQYPRGPSTAWQAGGPYMQQQALLRALALRTGNAQGKLPEKK